MEKNSWVSIYINYHGEYGPLILFLNNIRKYLYKTFLLAVCCCFKYFTRSLQFAYYAEM